MDTADDRTFCHQNSSSPWPVAAMEAMALLAFLGKVPSGRMVVAFCVEEGMVNVLGSDSLLPLLVERGRMTFAALTDSGAEKKVAVRDVIYVPVIYSFVLV